MSDEKHPYLLIVRTNKSSFSLGFPAGSDEDATAYATHWLNTKHLGHRGDVFRRRPDGTELLLSDQVEDQPSAIT